MKDGMRMGMGFRVRHSLETILAADGLTQRRKDAKIKETL